MSAGFWVYIPVRRQGWERGIGNPYVLWRTPKSGHLPAMRGQWKYVLEDGGAVITGCVVIPSGELVMPGGLDGYPVTGFGDEAFSMCDDLTSVKIPDRAVSIGKDLFYYYEELTLSVMQGSYAEEYAKENGIPYEYMVE